MGRTAKPAKRVLLLVTAAASSSFASIHCCGLGAPGVGPCDTTWNETFPASISRRRMSERFFSFDSRPGTCLNCSTYAWFVLGLEPTEVEKKCSSSVIKGGGAIVFAV